MLATHHCVEVGFFIAFYSHKIIFFLLTVSFGRGHFLLSWIGWLRGLAVMAFIYFVVIVSLEPENFWTLGGRSIGRTNRDGRIFPKILFPTLFIHKI